MKTKKSVRRAHLLHSKLAAYSATATAALLAAPIAADATVQDITTFSYDGGNTFVTNAPSAVGDNGSGGFQTINFLAGPFNGGIINFNSSGSGGAGIHGSIAGPSASAAYRLNTGAALAGPFFYGNHKLASFYSASNDAINQFLPSASGSVIGYVGFKAGSYYGWLRVKVTADGNDIPNSISLVDKNGDGIFGAFDKASEIGTDGFTIGSLVPVPEPSVAAIGGLGLLALGAAGVREMRRRKKAQEKI